MSPALSSFKRLVWTYTRNTTARVCCTLSNGQEQTFADFIVYNLRKNNVIVGSNVLKLKN